MLGASGVADAPGPGVFSPRTCFRAAVGVLVGGTLVGVAVGGLVVDVGVGGVDVGVTGVGVTLLQVVQPGVVWTLVNATVYVVPAVSAITTWLTPPLGANPDFDVGFSLTVYPAAQSGRPVKST